MSPSQSVVGAHLSVLGKFRGQKRIADDELQRSVEQVKKRRNSLHQQPQTLAKRPNPTDSSTVNAILAAIYWDINYVAILKGIAGRDKKPEDIEAYKLKCKQAQQIIDAAAYRVLNQKIENNDVVPNLYYLEYFLKRLGWMMLSMCAFSDGFREALHKESRETWWDLVSAIESNYFSLEVFARIRNLDWRGVLIPWSGYPIADLVVELQPLPPISPGNKHPHNLVHTVNGTLRVTTYKGVDQVNIEQTKFSPKQNVVDGKQLPNPTIRGPHDGDCDLCRSKTTCTCVLNGLAGTLMELVEHPDKGVGVRALGNFRKGEILGEYVGEIRPNGYLGDPIYSLTLTSKKKQSKQLCYVSGKIFGNWTRYISHSCNSNTDFNTRTVGDRLVMTIEAKRDIAIFEEITINYGSEYWKENKIRCKCGEEKCKWKD